MFCQGLACPEGFVGSNPLQLFGVHATIVLTFCTLLPPNRDDHNLTQLGLVLL